MAKPGKKAGKRAAAPRGAKPVRKPKTARSKAARPRQKSGAPATAAARLKSQLRAARDRQNATADILKVIASSPSDVQPVFQAIAQSARRLLGSYTAVVTRVIDGVVHLAAGTSENEAAAHAVQGLLPYPLSSPRIHAKVARTGEVAFNIDAKTSDLPQSVKAFARTVGWRSMLVVPMLHNGIAIGTIGITRREPGSFDEDTIDLLKTFADQAVIAIENTRLFNETREALARQAAVAQILEVINGSPGNLAPVFDAILERATSLCGAGFGALAMHNGGDMHQVVALRGAPPALADMLKGPIRLGPETGLGRLVRGENFVHIADASDDEGYRLGNPVRRALVDVAGARTYLAVPIRKDDVLLGSFTIYRREVRPFSRELIALLQSFAAQAAIAIDNARLFKETKEALERQTATSEVLQVISRSSGELAPVFESLLASAKHLCGAEFGIILLREGDAFRTVALHGTTAEYTEARWRAPVLRPAADTALGRVLETKQSVQIADVRAVAGYVDNPVQAPIVHLAGVRSKLSVPMLKEKDLIGVIEIDRQEVRPFTDKQIELVQNFADQAVIAIENARLLGELRQRTDDLSESLQQQVATADILKVISDSPGRTEPVFDKILASARQLCDARFGHLLRFDGETWRAQALHNLPEAYARFWNTTAVVAEPETNLGRVQRSGKFDQVPDIRIASGYLARSPLGVATVELGGARTLLTVPLLKEGKVIGGIAVYRTEVRPFDAKQIRLLSSFADQAVIAIENARLFNATQEALERQTATSEILKVIASSPSDVQPVFDAIAKRATQLVGGHSTTVLRVVGNMIDVAAFTPVNARADAALRAPFPMPIAGNPPFEMLLRGETSELADTETDTLAHIKEMARARGFRSRILVPLRSDGNTLGAISVTRVETGSFADHHKQLLQTFADQAVIAIENVRLFNETKEALERQTATAEILKVIASSPSDVQPVFEAIADQSNRLLNGLATAVYRVADGMAHLMSFTPVSTDADAYLKSMFPVPLAAAFWGGPLQNGKIFAVVDTEDDWVPPRTRELSRIRGWRSAIYAPLLHDGTLIGVISVTRREPGAFADDHIQLLRTFADQAAIAIQNARLFNEVQARTADLQEALQQQTATADVLKVISRSTFDLDTVLTTLTQSAVGLCRAARGAVFLRDGDVLRIRANAGNSPEFIAFLTANPFAPTRQTFAGRTFLTGEITHAPDVLADPEYDFGPAPEIGGFRSVLAVPLLREGRVEGVFSLSRPEPGSFTDREIELIRTFADQAVIAIENARLFNEVQARTRDLSESLEQQTATSEVLEVISSSAGELAPVFDKMLENATRICGANFGTMSLYDGDKFQNVALYNLPALYAASPASHTFRPHPESALATVARTGQLVQLEDIRTHRPYLEGDPAVVALTDLAGARTLVAVPMLKEKQLVGTIAIFRQEVRPFTDKQIALVSNFANQAVIAIENTRLLRELRERTDDLSTSLDELRAAQDRLVQTEKLASLGQLTAGIAHEIKNPLNFINNFSSLSAELTDELNDILRSAELTDKTRQEVDELTGLLKDNLEKVVQHGKRADSIVKNMLLHSRQGSGEQRLVDINALVDESLNLAYHGARAERAGFTITLRREFDASTGSAELFPQEISRALLNLISNGFYAATRRRNDDAARDFEPTLLATTKDLGSSVEIRIRDNGAGIPPAVREKMFNPFFTTKPAGEGTGLGLSMTHDIIVKQHGGSIDVATEPGQFSEFTIVLPRTSRSPNGTDGRS